MHVEPMSVTWRDLGLKPLSTGIDPDTSEWMTDSILRFEDGQVVLSANHWTLARSITLIFLGDTTADDDRVVILGDFTEPRSDFGAMGSIYVINAACDQSPINFHGERDDVLRRLAIGMQKTIRAHLCGDSLPTAAMLDGS